MIVLIHVDSVNTAVIDKKMLQSIHSTKQTTKKNNTMTTLAYGVDGPQDKFHAFEITRRDVGDYDVKLDILYAGICHTDIHHARDDWKMTHYPLVPGHEILGRVIEIGSKVTNFRVGDLGGIGCFIDSCGECTACKEDLDELHCHKGVTFTYGGLEQGKSTYTLGGYSKQIVSTERFVLKISKKFTDLKGIAPLLCAGITTYYSLISFPHKVCPGKKVGVVGLGGLGHMGVKFAVAMGAEVTVFSTSASKEADAKRLGAHHFVNTKDGKAVAASFGKYDFILDTLSATHDINILVNYLNVKGVLGLVGAPPEPFKNLDVFPLLMGNKIIVGSPAGTIKETQNMLDFCAEHNITADVEVVKMEQVEEAYERILKSDVKYRFVIDVSAFKP